MTDAQKQVIRDALAGVIASAVADAYQAGARDYAENPDKWSELRLAYISRHYEAVARAVEGLLLVEAT